MFIWARFYLTASPRFATYSKQADPEQAFMTDLWQELADEQVSVVSLIGACSTSVLARLRRSLHLG